MFEFVACATDEPGSFLSPYPLFVSIFIVFVTVLLNIESKVDGDYRNLTRSPEDFVNAYAKLYPTLGADVMDRITHQSFDVSFLSY